MVQHGSTILYNPLVNFVVVVCVDTVNGNLDALQYCIMVILLVCLSVFVTLDESQCYKYRKCEMHIGW